MSQIKAIVFDPPDALQPRSLLRDIPCPEALAGQVLVRVHRAGLNFADLMMRKGHLPWMDP